ncbi:thiamine ABC transporter substrate-binding protein [Shigella flexneri]
MKPTATANEIRGAGRRRVTRNRLRMEGKNSKADVVLGLDNNLLQAATDTNLFAKSNVPASAVSVPGGWTNNTFVPFDYGYFAFVYDKNKLKNPPKA